MKRISVLFLFCLLSEILYAQNPVENPFGSQPESPEGQWLNEIGLNLSPLAVRALSGNWLERYELMYRRIHHEGPGAYRLSLFYTRETEEYGYRLDSSEVSISREKSISSLKPGYEWQKTWKRATFFWGSDLLLGFSNSLHQIEQNFFLRSPGDTIVWSQSILNRREFILGLSPFIGLKVHLSPRWSVNLQTGFRAVAGIGTHILTEREGPVPFQGNPNQVRNQLAVSTDIETTHFINYLGLSFHF